MNKRIPISLTIAIAAVIPSGAQSPGSSFDEFRAGILNGYSSFRNSVLENYDKFLDGVWTEYESFKGLKSDTTPKPVSAPKADTTPVVKDSTPVPAPVADKPAHRPEPKPAPKPKPAPQPAPETGPTPSPVVSHPAEDTVPFRFDFYGMEMQIPDIEIRITERLSSTKDFGRQWRDLSKSGSGHSIVPELKKLASRLQLNDYLTYELTRDYVNGRYPQAHSTGRMSLIHFILANMGYDARIGMTNNGHAILLLPFNQQVYARPFMSIDNRTYYVFADKDIDLENPANMRITTCQLPKDAETGASLELRLTPLNLPYKAQPFSLKAAGLEVNGELNANILPVIYRYPQMPMGEYAQSEILPDIRRSVVEQLKPQVADMTEHEAVDALLHFTQNAFEYSRDDAFHGFEKPYFFEETLFYPKCDCEDRAIFYTYLLWHVLGVENQLINYPGHESASVRLSEPIKGDYYDHKGTRYYISDPTYIGSSSGMCMPTYRHQAPTVDHTYSH